MTGGIPTTIIESATQALGIRFRYKDAIGNLYEPIEIEIPIQDSRTDKKQKVKLPINLKWIHELINPLEEGVTCDS